MLLLAVLEERLAEAQDQADSLQSQLSESAARCNSLTEDQQALKQQLQAKQTQADNTLQQLAAAEQKAANLEAACQQQSGNAADLQSKLTVSGDTMSSLQAKLDSQTSRNAGAYCTRMSVSWTYCSTAYM